MASSNRLKAVSEDGRVAKNGWQPAFRELLFPGRFPKLKISTGGVKRWKELAKAI